MKQTTIKMQYHIKINSKFAITDFMPSETKSHAGSHWSSLRARTFCTQKEADGNQKLRLIRGHTTIDFAIEII